jgi:uncharacterized protein YbjT (DUF2867 family)
LGHSTEESRFKERQHSLNAELFANWTENRFLTLIAPATTLALVAVQDIGTAVAAAVADPEKFNCIGLELAGDLLTMQQIAEVLSEDWGETIKPSSFTPAEAVAQGLMPAFVNPRERLNEVGSQANPEQAHRFGLFIKSFRTWATPHRPVDGITIHGAS